MFKIHDSKPAHKKLLDKAADLFKPGADPSESCWGLCLGSGAAPGMAHLFFIEVLEEFDIHPREITGTSIGAVIGALYASGLRAREIRKVFADLGNIFELGKLLDIQFGNKYGLIGGKNIEKRLKELLRSANFSDLKTKLKVVATDFWSGEEVVFDAGPIHKALRASLSITGIFVPVKEGGRILVDGASSNPLPFDLLTDGCGLTLAVDVTGERSQDVQSKMPDMAEAIVSTIQIQQERLVEQILERRQPTLYIKPHIRGIGFLDFQKLKEIEEQVQPEVKALRKWLGERLGK